MLAELVIVPRVSREVSVERVHVDVVRPTAALSSLVRLPESPVDRRLPGSSTVRSLLQETPPVDCDKKSGLGSWFPLSAVGVLPLRIFVRGRVKRTIEETSELRRTLVLEPDGLELDMETDMGCNLSLLPTVRNVLWL